MIVSRAMALRFSAPIDQMFRELGKVVPDWTAAQLIRGAFTAIALLYVRAVGRDEVERVFGQAMAQADALITAAVTLETGAELVDVPLVDDERERLAS